MRVPPSQKLVRGFLQSRSPSPYSPSGPPWFASCVALLKFAVLELKLFLCSQKKQWGVKYHLAFRSFVPPPVWGCRLAGRFPAMTRRLKAAKFRNFGHNTSAKSLPFSCEDGPAIRHGRGHNAVFVVSTNVLFSSVHLAKWEIAQNVCTHAHIASLSSHVISIFILHICEGLQYVKGCTS